MAEVVEVIREMSQSSLLLDLLPNLSLIPDLALGDRDRLLLVKPDLGDRDRLLLDEPSLGDRDRLLLVDVILGDRDRPLLVETSPGDRLLFVLEPLGDLERLPLVCLGERDRPFFEADILGERDRCLLGERPCLEELGFGEGDWNRLLVVGP
jgi:hypothetical protein